VRARPASGCSYTRSHANTAASVLIIYRTAIAPEWIDYNGHLRDAYYGLIVSYAADALMDKIGMDAAYRDRTHRTLYTVEMHLHFLREVKHSDTVSVGVRILGTDRKRIHAAFDLTRESDSEAAASCEIMLLQMQQTAETTVVAFDEEIKSALDALAQATAALPAVAPGSRRMQLRPR